MEKITESRIQELKNLVMEEFKDLDSLTQDKTGYERTKNKGNSLTQQPGKTNWSGSKPGVFTQQDIIDFLKKHPGSTEREIQKSVYGYEGNNTLKKSADTLRRALNDKKIDRTTELKKGKNTYTYWVPEDLVKFQDFQKEKGVKNIKIKESTIPTKNRLLEIAGLEEDIDYDNDFNETFDRMYNLANISDLKICIAKLRMLTTDWVHEGFEKEDVKKFMSNIIDQI